MIVPEWAGPYMGLPYRDKGRTREGFDCWGLVRQVLLDVAGLELPDYSGAYASAQDGASVAAAVAAGLRDGWQQVPDPRPLDLLILRVAGRPWHCAIMVNATMFLHVPPPREDGLAIDSCVERLDSPVWSSRIVGLYRREVHG